MLTKRQSDVLKLIVQAHIEGGEPVASKAVHDRSQLGVSPATIRSVMSDLEEMGYLLQPHTSSGRVPTDLGFRLYVDHLLEVASLTRTEKERILHACRAGGEDLHATLSEVSQVLAALTPNASIVRTHGPAHAVLRRVQFIKLATGSSREERILALLISESGGLLSRVFFPGGHFEQKNLDNFGQYLSNQMQGRDLAGVREHLLREVEQGEAEHRALCRNLLESVSSSSAAGGLIINGRMNVFSSPLDFSRIREILELLEEKRSLVRLLDECLVLEGVQLFIGAESKLGASGGCTMVAANFVDGANAFQGAVGVLGPTRLNYAHVIPLVDFTAKVLSTLLPEPLAGPSVRIPQVGYSITGEKPSS